MESEDNKPTNSPEDNQNDDIKNRISSAYLLYLYFSKKTSNLNEANIKAYITARFTYSQTKLKNSFGKVKNKNCQKIPSAHVQHLYLSMCNALNAQKLIL